jgi:uncharacterized protein YidB (DUF937 family)
MRSLPTPWLGLAPVMLRKAVVQPVGANQYTKGGDNIMTHNDGYGTSRSYTLSRLQQQRPELYERATPDGRLPAGLRNYCC